MHSKEYQELGGMVPMNALTDIIKHNPLLSSSLLSSPLLIQSNISYYKRLVWAGLLGRILGVTSEK